MKRFILLVLLILCSSIECVHNHMPHMMVKRKVDRWELMYKALCTIESELHGKAYNHSTQAAGIIQIRPIYVKEVNRILGWDKYTLKDRFNPQKSKEMFEIYQAYYNPDKNIDKAIRLHNPTASEVYHSKIKEKMKILHLVQKFKTDRYEKV